MVNEKWFRISSAVLGVIGLTGLYFFWWTENLLQNLFVMGVCMWLTWFGLKLFVAINSDSFNLAPRRAKVSREDFFRCIQSLEAENVNVSAGEILEGKEFMDACLIQVGTPTGHYTCAYLNDQQVRNLIVALTDYLAAEKR